MIVFVPELFERMNFRDVFPAAAVKRFEESGKADVFDDTFPVNRKFEIAKRFRRDVVDVFFLRQKNRFRNRHAEFGGEAKVEKFVVRRPPERIVDDIRSFERETFSTVAR